MYSGNYVATLYGKVLDELTNSLNFTLDIVSEVTEHGMWKGKNNTWSGVMDEIVSGRADFAIADMSMTSLRVRYVDFTLPLIISRSSLFIKEPGICGVKWLGYFQVISRSARLISDQSPSSSIFSFRYDSCFLPEYENK